MKKKKKTHQLQHQLAAGEGSPQAGEHLINPRRSSLNEVLITPTDSLKTRALGRRARR